MKSEKIKSMIEAATKKLDELVARSDKAEQVEELRSLNGEIAESRKNLDELNALLADVEDEEKKAEEARGKNPIMINNTQVKTGDAEYRSAFKNFVQNGTPIPAELITDNMKKALSGIHGERRGTTLATEISALIPTTVMDEVVREAGTGVYGQLYNRVRKTNIRGGVRYPLSNLKASFTWGVDGYAPEGQKAGDANTYIEFGSYLGVSQINTSLIASIESEPAFYNELVRLIQNAFYEAMDKAIVSGTGVGQPLGITKDPRVTKSVVLDADTITKWTEWEKIVQAVPLTKRGGHIVLSIGTIDKYLRTLADDNNRPLFYDSTINMGGVDANGIEGRFAGQQVLAVENDVLKNFDEAASGDVIGFYAPLNDYAVNSNLQFAVSTYRDEKTLEDITRGLVIVDGKPLDVTGMVLIKKA